MGKNVKKVISLVLVFAMILTGMTFTGFDAKAADAANDTSATAEMEQLKNGSTTMLLMQMICLTREMHMFWLSRTM